MNETWIAIARTGTFKDSEGRPQTFTSADLDVIAANYHPEKQEVPLVFGHPQTSDPAYGWVKEVQRRGDKLFARLASVPAAVKKLVSEGRYRYVSMSLTPDKKSLRHVGLLGAVPPAIDGLGPVQLAGEPGLTINFSAPDGEGDTMAQVEELQQQIGALQSQLEALRAENAELKSQVEELTTAKDDAEKKAEDTASEFASYKNGIETMTREKRVDALIASGKLEPGKKKEAMSFASALASVSVSVDFSSSDGKTEQISAEEKYFRDLEAREPDARFTDFSSFAPAPAHTEQGEKTFNPSDLTARL